MDTTQNGLQKPVSEDFITAYNNNVDILDEHLSNTDIHLNAGKIAEITEPDQLTQIDSTDTNSTMWGKIKKSISEVTNHVDKVASETILGHVKIGTGLQMTDDVVNVKIANNLQTVDETTALSAAMGVKLNSCLNETNTKFDQHIKEIASSDTLGHIKIGDGLLTAEGGTTSVKIANNLTTDDSTTVLSAAMGKNLNEALNGKAPTNHASSGTGYGVGNVSQYGHVKLSDNYTSSAGTAANGVGASSKAVNDVYNNLNAKFNWNAITFTKNSSYVNNNQSWAWRMGQVCICEIIIETSTSINAFESVKVGTVSVPSKMSMQCIAQIQSTSKTGIFTIGNINLGSDEGYDIYFHPLNNSISSGEWIRANLIYFTY